MHNHNHHPCRYQRTGDVLHFVKELEAAIERKLNKQQPGAQRGSRSKKQQQDQQLQLQQQYAAAAAAAPDLEGLTVDELRSFVQQVRLTPASD